MPALPNAASSSENTDRRREWVSSKRFDTPVKRIAGIRYTISAKRCENRRIRYHPTPNKNSATTSVTAVCRMGR